jgi:hypothetical protein
MHAEKHEAGKRCQVIRVVIEDARNGGLENAGSPPNRHSMLHAVGSHLTDQVGAIGHEVASEAM